MMPRVRLSLAMIAVLGAMPMIGCGSHQEQAAPATQTNTASTATNPATAPPSTAAETNPSTAQAPPPAVEPPAPKPPAAAKPKRTVPKEEIAKQSEPAAPAPAPVPEPIVKTVAAGTDLDVEFLTGASSKTSHVGDPLRARFTKAVVVDGVIVIPEGAIVTGRVTEATPLKKIGGAASLGLKFDTLELPDGGKASFAADFNERGKSETGKDAGTIAGAAAGGALLGRLLSKNSKTNGTLIGAAVGAGVGTGIAASTKGQEVELPEGSHVALRLDAPLTLTIKR